MATAKKNTAIDFAGLDPADAHERGVRVRLNNPLTGKPTDGYVTVRGNESHTMQQHLRAVLDARRGKDNEEPPTAELEAAAIKELTVATIKWEGIGLGSTEEAEPTEANCKKLYSIKKVRRQLFEAMREDSNFLSD